MSTPQDGEMPQVRRLVESDWAALRAARLAALADAPDAFSSTIAREQAFTEDIWRSRIRTAGVYAAWSGNAIVGMATGRLTDSNPSWELVGMWVSPDWRGTGIAGRLVSEVCEYARRAGAAGLCLWVVETNVRAIGLYRRLGFAPTGGRQLVRDDEPDRFEIELARDFAVSPSGDPRRT